MAARDCAPAVVIGYGNPLRGDDGAGQLVADEVAAWGLPDLLAVTVHQLTPELAEILANARLAVFVDARLAHKGETITVQPLEPAGTMTTLGHVSDPTVLLALAQALYGRCPPAWWVLVPGVCFEPGDIVSATARRGVADALRQIASLVSGKEPAHA